MASEGVIEDVELLAGMSAAERGQVAASRAAGLSPGVLPAGHPARRLAESRPKGSGLELVAQQGELKTYRLMVAPGVALFVVDGPNGVAAAATHLPA